MIFDNPQEQSSQMDIRSGGYMTILAEMVASRAFLAQA